jgi:hypothetical protein
VTLDDVRRKSGRRRRAVDGGKRDCPGDALTSVVCWIKKRDQSGLSSGGCVLQALEDGGKLGALVHTQASTFTPSHRRDSRLPGFDGKCCGVVVIRPRHKNKLASANLILVCVLCVQQPLEFLRSISSTSITVQMMGSARSYVLHAP